MNRYQLNPRQLSRFAETPDGYYGDDSETEPAPARKHEPIDVAATMNRLRELLREEKAA